ncbi:MFS general substrate transporter [Acephala macrosclerotiorum]|nr:MFS general substrate transporter [Acephala macrosclerotiorum]
MDLDGDMDDGLDLIWGEPEPKIESPESLTLPTRSVGFLLLLTAGLGGLQSIFALIFSNGSAHLSSLGLSKPVLALVWMAGPVAGMTLQPYFGICSDQCRSPWGRRRPFIACGTLAAVVSLIGLASAEKLSQVLVHLWASDSSHAEAAARSLAAGVAVVFFVVLNVAVQPIQGGVRALLADICPQAQQPAVNAVAGIVVSASNIFSYALGFIDLPRLGPLRALGGNSQFSILCVVTSATLVVSIALTCLAVRERNPMLDEDVLQKQLGAEEDSGDTVYAMALYLCTSFPRLPQQVRQVCKVQFFSWMGWFPFLFYMTTYIGNRYKSSMATASGRPSPTDQEVQARSTRIGSFGLLLFALVALVAGAILPLAHKHASCQDSRKVVPSGINVTIRRFGSIRCLWIMSHVLFACCMLATFFISSLQGVCILVGLSGISWAITIWAPYAIISTHISHDGDDGGTYLHCSEPLVLHYSESEEEEDDQQFQGRYGEKGDGNDETCERRPGIAFGLHNAAIAGPQIVAAAACSLIFWMLEGSSQDGIVWALRAGGLAALGAAVLARGVREEDSGLGPGRGSG